jgi:uncharacterized protein
MAADATPPHPEIAVTGLPRAWLSGSAPHNHKQCDCACPQTHAPAGLSHLAPGEQALLAGQIGHLQQPMGLWRLSLSDKTALFGPMAQRLVVLDAAGEGLLAYFAVPHTWAEAQEHYHSWPPRALARLLALLIDSDLLHAADVGLGRSSLAEPDTLSAWLHLTNRCTLACEYCYVTQDGQSMPPATAERGVEAVFRSAQAHSFGQVQLKYAGGEPTLNFVALVAAQRRAEALSAATGIALETVLLTNGQDVAEPQLDFLLGHGIGATLSLDGLGQDHEAGRPRRDGDGSFRRVQASLDTLLARGVRPQVMTTLTAYNLAGLPALVEYLLERQVAFAFNFWRPVGLTDSLGGLATEADELIASLRRAYRVIGRRPPAYSLLAGLADRADLSAPHGQACGAGQSYLTVDPVGAVAVCQMEMARPVSHIGASDPLAAVLQKADGSLRQGQRQDCRECFWRWHCAGGCPRRQSPVLCSVYKAILPDILRLEAQRLLTTDAPWNYSLN